MKLVGTSLAALAATVAAQDVAVPEPEMSWVDWMEEYVPGFTATSKYYKFENTDYNVMWKYDFNKNTFEMDTPWFTEEWSVQEDEGMWELNYAATCGESKSIKLKNKQGVEERVKKGKVKGTQWIQLFDLKMKDKSMDNGIMAVKRQITTEMDKKDKFTAMKYEDKFQYGKMKGQVKTTNFPKYDKKSGDWYASTTKFNAMFDDGNGTMVQHETESYTEMTRFSNENNMIDIAVETTHHDKTNDVTYNMASEVHVHNTDACMFAYQFCSKAWGPQEWITVDEMAEAFEHEDEFKGMICNEDGCMDSAAIRTMAEEVHSMLEQDANGNMVMAKTCGLSMVSTYPNMDTGAQETCELDIVFRNMMDMSVNWNSMEIVKVTNKVENGAMMYTVHMMGEEMYSVDFMKWHETMQGMKKMVMQQIYYMYKEHEMYIMEMMDYENFDWHGFMGMMGNWDYIAERIANMEHDMLTTEKAKCDISLVDREAEWGVYLAEAGEREALKKYDEHIQFYEFIMDNDINLKEYMCSKMCDQAKEMGWDMMEYMNEDGDMPMTTYPEFTYEERSSAEMQVALTDACHYKLDWMLTEHAAYSKQCLDNFRTYRDAAVESVQQCLDNVNDRVGAVAAFDRQWDMVESLREGQWACEFDFHCDDSMTEEERAVRMLECANLPVGN